MQTPLQRPPPWVWAAAATYFAYLSLMAWCGLMGPAESGIRAAFDSSGMLIAAVARNSASSTAGLLPGDRVSDGNSTPIRSRFDWMAISANWDTFHPIELIVERKDQQSRVQLRLTNRPWSDAGLQAILGALTFWGARLFTLLAACFAIWKAKDFQIALTGAWFLASASVASVVLLPGIAKAWSAVPAPGGLLFWFPALSSLLLPAIFFSFLARFPRSGILPLWGWIAAWTPWAVLVAWFAGYLQRVIGGGGKALGWMPDWYAPVCGACSLVYIAGGVGIQLWNARTMASQNDRRCAKWLAIASVVGWAASMPIVVFDWEGAAASVAPAFFESRAAMLSGALFMSSLAALSLILLRRRVFGFRLILRTGLRYALARRVLVSVAPVCAVVLLADLMLHGEEPLMKILHARGQWYLAIAALALFAQSRRDRWLQALDRRFFREHYGAQRILLEMAEIARNAGAFENAAPLVTERLQQAFHAEFAAIMTRSAGSRDYTCCSHAPEERTPPSLPSDSKLLSLVKTLGKPMELTLNSSWLHEQLSPRELEAAKAARIELIVPIAAGLGPVEAILIAGPKLSEEPYSREDQDLLAAISASLALLLAHTPARPHQSASGLLRECLVCGACFDNEHETCGAEGTPLTPRPVPRLLSDRYRLERRLGAGGMGTVYEALDTELERRVAVKLIHDSLVGSASAAARFKREARAAAGFTHPNIVTIYDFGVAAGTRAFIVMELLAGRSLRETINEAAQYPLPATSTLLRGICDGVDTAHQRQLLHRDLKPENIYVTGDPANPVPKILDFGLVKSISPNAETETVAVTQPGTVVGTVRYMAPELLAGGLPQKTADLWALAVICYEMLTGAYPFEAPDSAMWRDAVLSGRYHPVGEHLLNAPAEFDRLFALAFAPDPDRRPGTAREFHAALGTALTQFPPAPPTRQSRQ